MVKLPTLRRSIREQVRRLRSLQRSESVCDANRLKALESFMDAVEAADVEMLFRKGDWDMVIFALNDIIWNAPLEVAARGASVLSRTNRRLLAVHGALHEQPPGRALTTPLLVAERSERLTRLAAFARTRVLTLPVLIRRLFRAVLDAPAANSEACTLLQNAVFSCLSTNCGTQDAQHSQISLSSRLSQLIYSLVCFAYEVDQASLDVLLDHVCAIWRSVATEPSGWNAPLPWMLEAPASITDAFWASSAPCLERQCDMATASVHAVLAALLSDMKLAADAQRRLLYRIHSMIQELRAARDSFHVAPVSSIPYASEWFFEALTTRLVDEPQLVCLILSKLCGFEDDNPDTSAMLLVSQTQMRCLVRTITLRHLLWQAEACEAAARILLLLLSSSVVVKNLEACDFALCIFVACLMLSDARNYPGVHQSRSIAAKNGLEDRTTVQGENWRHQYGDLLLSALVPVFGDTQLRPVLLFNMLHYRCSKAMIRFLGTGGEINIRDAFAVSVLRDEQHIAAQVQAALGQTRERLESLFAEEPVPDYNEAFPQIRSALHAAASAVEQGVRSACTASAIMKQGEAGAGCVSISSVSEATRPSMASWAWTAALSVYAREYQDAAPHFADASHASDFSCSPADVYAALNTLHGLLAEEIVIEARKATDAAWRYERLRIQKAAELEILRKLLDEADAAKRELEQSTQCPVCFERLHAPSALVPCGHVLCKSCFVTLTTTLEEHLCPTCRQVFDPISALRIHLN
jgi:hypothetical protein